MKTCDDYPGECCLGCHKDEASVRAGDLDHGGLMTVYTEHPTTVYARVCCAKAHRAHLEVLGPPPVPA